MATLPQSSAPRYFLLLACGLASSLSGCSTPDRQAASGPPALIPATAAPPAATAAAEADRQPPAAASGASRGGRIAPPAAITCDPNQLTAWFGVVSGYRRDGQQTWLRINTDYDTVEQTTLDHAGAADASAHYLLWGERFTARDWPSIEQAPGRLVRDMRAVVWVCADGHTPPVVDWQPARE